MHPQLVSILVNSSAAVFSLCCSVCLGCVVYLFCFVLFVWYTLVRVRVVHAPVHPVEPRVSQPVILIPLTTCANGLFGLFYPGPRTP